MTQELHCLVFKKIWVEKLFSHKTWTQMFIEVLFIIATICNQSRCLLVGEWINKLWYIQAIDLLFSNEKKWAITQLKDMEET